MEEELEPTKVYVDGFNAGRIMQKYDPNLLTNILSATKDRTDYIKGLLDGKKQILKELMNEKITSSEKYPKDNSKGKQLEP